MVYPGAVCEDRPDAFDLRHQVVMEGRVDIMETTGPRHLKKGGTIRIAANGDKTIRNPGTTAAVIIQVRMRSSDGGKGNGNIK